MKPPIPNLPNAWYRLDGVPADPFAPVNPVFAPAVPATGWVRVTDANLREISWSARVQVELFLTERGFISTSDPVIWVASPAIFVETMAYSTMRIIELRVWS